MLTIILGTLFSCVSKKNLVYLQDDSFSSDYPTQIKNRRPDYRIQPNDVLHVTIQNPDNETSAFFNYGNQDTGQGYGSESVLYLMGFNVDKDGFISIPLIGKVKVQNLTIEECQQIIQQEANKYILNSSVAVKLVSFKISVLGEVNNPGYYYIYNGQASVLEGLSKAGDLNQFANRNNIKLIRQTDDGVEVTLLDLSSSDLMKSKYYYLLPNDVIYVEPSEAQVRRTNTQPLGVFFGGLGALISVVNLIISINNSK
uniref:Polysaccharide export protein n=1 Tax=Roseihalotalea indica TaxID=2867963 RepID=A0AA49GLB7_9BACT|nr:polysaccharide export protein [Tunicatimonas sp. TK19036]